MDKDKVEYLANLAAVRNHASTLLNIGRGVIDQKTLHQVSYKASALDKLFVDVLMGGPIPGSKSSSVKLPNDEDDFVDIGKRLAEAKAEVAARKGLIGKTKLPQKAPTMVIEPDPDSEPEDEPSDEEDSDFEPPEDEVEAFQALLNSVETQVQTKKSLNRPAIKGSRKGK